MQLLTAVTSSSSCSSSRNSSSKKQSRPWRASLVQQCRSSSLLQLMLLGQLLLVLLSGLVPDPALAPARYMGVQQRAWGLARRMGLQHMDSSSAVVHQSRHHLATLHVLALALE
jgi:hypothetical protein